MSRERKDSAYSLELIHPNAPTMAIHIPNYVFRTLLCVKGSERKAVRNFMIYSYDLFFLALERVNIVCKHFNELFYFYLKRSSR
jgi:hypothetical protein